jgi:hypothetical protein
LALLAPDVRLIHAYLIGYSILVLGALAALWHGGALSRIGPMWIVLALAIAAGFGGMLAVSTARTEMNRDPDL